MANPSTDEQLPRIEWDRRFITRLMDQYGFGYTAAADIADQADIEGYETDPAGAADLEMSYLDWEAS